MNIPELKIDKKFFHHYIFSVAAKTAKSSNPGELYIKHGPIYFTNDDIIKVHGAAILSQDRLFVTDQRQAIKNFQCGELVHSIHAIKLAAAANECTIHHFSSEYEIDCDFFEDFVKNANHLKSNRKMLRKARIG